MLTGLSRGSPTTMTSPSKSSQRQERSWCCALCEGDTAPSMATFVSCQASTCAGKRPREDPMAARNTTLLKSRGRILLSIAGLTVLAGAAYLPFHNDRDLSFALWG